VDGTLAGAVLAERRAFLVVDPTADPRTADAPGLGATIAAPVIGDRGIHGVLIVTHDRNGGSFSAADTDMITTFAAQAALVLDVAELRRDNERVQVLEDRQRIAGDLQQTVIRELFALGLSLQSTAARITNPDLRQAVGAGVEELDRIIRNVQAAVFALEPGNAHHQTDTVAE
jgi:signal transduction histidine kinase